MKTSGHEVTKYSNKIGTSCHPLPRELGFHGNLQNLDKYALKNILSTKLHLVDVFSPNLAQDRQSCLPCECISFFDLDHQTQGQIQGLFSKKARVLRTL